jgi:hypothetical protein
VGAFCTLEPLHGSSRRTLELPELR